MGIGKIILEAVYPPVCPICDRVVKKPACICGECRKKLHYIQSPRCFKCGKPVENAEKELCFDCSRTKHCFDRNLALWGYTDAARKSIYRFKYHNCRIYSQVYGREIADRLGTIIKQWNCEAVVPVPIHSKKQRERGFNQAQLLAQEVADVAKIPVDTKILVRTRYTRPQKELDDRNRIKNLENAFTVTKNVVQYKKIILVDDIYTTGATLDACARALKERGAGQVFAVCLCIGQGF